MSRLIVKNLPSYITDARLREHFASAPSAGGHGARITDVKLMFRQTDGAPRRFAFIGYKTEEDAMAAKEYFDRTFIDSSRISVLVINSNKNFEKPKKRQRVDNMVSPNHSRPIEKSAAQIQTPSSGEGVGPQDEVLSEFLQVMQRRNPKHRLWANDDPGVSKQVQGEASDKSQASTSAEVLEDPHDPTLSDLEWMRSRMARHALSDEQPEASNTHGSLETKEPVDEHVDEVPPQTEDFGKGTVRLFLRNIPYSCASSELEAAFSKFGPVAEAHIPIHPRTKESKGVAFVTFTDSEHASAAYKEMNGSTFQGRVLQVFPAAEKRGDTGGENNLSLKEKKLEDARKSAGKYFNWATLYMNSDAVVSSIADRFKIEKANILNPDSNDAAVKLALAETHIIQETKKFLEDHGVMMDSFRSAPRSQTTLLAKNIPYGTTVSELNGLFSPHGEITRLLLPPAGTIAVVEFAHADEAAKALRAVAYRRVGNSVVYLEKAPLGIFKDDAETARQRTESSVADTPKDEVAGSSPESTLFIKNLAFATTTEKLRDTFARLPSFISAHVQTKPDPKNPGGTLSMGYGFIRFKDKTGAMNALKSIQGFTLDGHSLIADHAKRGADDTAGGDKKATVGRAMSAKLIVKNVPFEATKKDVWSLVSAHGQLKSVRLPRKFDGGTRGFAFLEFVSRHEAENAFTALQHTHLLGRHLVLQWAEDGEDSKEEALERMREKVRIGYGDGNSELPGRKRKFDMEGGLEGDDLDDLDD
ncbi:uncharacterized protein EI90DRAFT_3152914 [Cantharellus anzutake]|uniref:uncharacterized protein n=1 Tax=Cantharellus anzutake TaxID=1750568 RepID=UPI001905E5A5|nr:uncharacterized protein EI90DRAFT_3152914 [Cantharellus anzutake]KAF8335941.1 hypothetical protein EI90DRAFT_3152914 [Cantharellus anzutake]